MKEGTLFIVVGLALIAGAVWYFLPAPARDLFGGSKTVIQTHDPEPAKAPGDSKPPKAPKIAKLVRPEPPLPPASNPAAVTEVIVPVPPLPFPSAREVRPGTERDQLKDTFGPPTLEASTADQGHLFETYVYKKDRAQAVIRLRDGKVYSFHMK